MAVGVRRQLGPLRGSPTWQSIMVSSSFNSIFFSPVSAHSSASRTGPSGRPPSFFKGASQSGEKAMVGGHVGKLSLEDSPTCPGWNPCPLLQERGAPTLDQQQT